MLAERLLVAELELACRVEGRGAREEGHEDRLDLERERWAQQVMHRIPVLHLCARERLTRHRIPVLALPVLPGKSWMLPLCLVLWHRVRECDATLSLVDRCQPLRRSPWLPVHSEVDGLRP